MQSFLPSLPIAQTAHTRPSNAPLAGGSDHDKASSSEEPIPLTSPTDTMTQRRRRTREPTQRRPASSRLRALLPSARRFWADFTLGFADGLTVPFALTAGLSSLGGSTDTVVYAGMAEVSAGCISMGIGGYLSARPAAEAAAAAAAAAETSRTQPMEERRDLHHPQLPQPLRDSPETIADRYLAPLGLPLELHQLAVAHVVASGPQRAQALVHRTRGAVYEEDFEAEEEEDDEDDKDENDDDDNPVWPVAAGLSVALGYLVGGLLPLGPYFASASVGDGLRWSFAVCLVALFGFGFARDFFLEGPTEENDDDDDDREKAHPRLPWGSGARRRRLPWWRLRKSAGEGLQMVVLGGIAAVAAVLCVRLFESGGGSGGGGEGAAADTAT